MDLQPAARLGDEIAHGFGVVAMIGGAVAGALIGAAVVAATVATGGLAVAIMGGSIAAGGVSTFQIVSGLFQLFDLPEPTTGALQKGSNDVYINGRPAMRAGDDMASSCNGLPLNHPLWPFPVVIAEGSATVYINGKPAARLGSKMVCGAHIKSGSPDTFIGGPTISVAFVIDIQGWMHTGFEALGLLAAGAGLVLAAMAGAAVLATAVVVGAAAMAGMALLGDLGDRLGPGCRDLLQGVAGMALLGVGARLSKRTKSDPPGLAVVEELPPAVVTAKGSVGNTVFTDVNQKSRSGMQAKLDKLTLISEKVSAKAEKYGRPMPNGNMAEAHAEIGVIQQAYDKGLTRGQDMEMTVVGMKVCGYCKSDIVAMAKAAELKSLIIYEHESGTTLFWEQGMKKLAIREDK
jgi:uncharacterized Zn-binding protein involved in type VI secretion